MKHRDDKIVLCGREVLFRGSMLVLQVPRPSWTYALSPYVPSFDPHAFLPSTTYISASLVPISPITLFHLEPQWDRLLIRFRRT